MQEYIEQNTTKLTRKQESFCLNYFETGHAFNSAVAAGYSKKTAHVMGFENIRKPYIMRRLAELQAALEAKTGKAADNSIATVEERRQRLTQFVREDIETKHGISRQSNNQAIAELNKMDHIYDPAKMVFNDIKILVVREQPRELIEGDVVDDGSSH